MRKTCLVLCLWVAAAFAQPAVDFVQITDTHVADFTGVHPDLAARRATNQKTRVQLAQYVESLRTAPPAFLLHTGDAVDAVCFDTATLEAVCGQIGVFRNVMRNVPVPVYQALGNHDIERYRWAGDPKKPTGDQSIAQDSRRQWRKAMPALRKGTYYSFRKQAGRTRYRFIVLDNGESGDAGKAFAATQLDWLKRELARHRNEWIIIVQHIPLGKDDFSKSELALLAQSDRVVLAIAGHRHSDGLEDIALGSRKLLQVRTASFNSGITHARRFRLREDAIEISATARPDEIVRTIPLAAHSASVK